MMTISSSSTTLKRKLENESTTATTLTFRKKLCLKKFKQLVDIKQNLIETIAEHYYLKVNTKTYLDYPEWRLTTATKEYTDYLNEKLAAKNDISILEAKINSSENNQSTSIAVATTTTKFKYEYDQNAVHERAKHEASILQKIAGLRREGLWSIKRLPKLCEPKRPKAHWDYLLDEMMWMSTDFQQERKWKKAVSKKISGAVQKYFKDKEIKADVAEREELKRMRKNAANVAREIMNFWKNVEKVVEYKLKTIDEEKRKKELDMHLNFIVDQTEKYSSRLMKGLSSSSSAAAMTVTNVKKKEDEEEDDEYEDAIEEMDDDGEYNEENDSDDAIDNESTIESDEDINNYDVNEELRQLQMDSELPIEDLINNNNKVEEEEDDDDYSEDTDETTDVEDTIEEDEKNYVDNYEDELKQLEEDSKIPIDELKKNRIPAVEEEEATVESTNSSSGGDKDELNSIAAQAQMLQPTGYTLETTKVKTKIPFLLKYSLREYQHVGLDWLVTMYENKLNGILADEMGLGKTIQTIALLAHLAVEKGNWGPHLIVVPTSVMLNWELEIKKWCPAFKILTYYGTPKERKLKRQGWTKFNAFHICITSYKLVTQDHGAFRRKKWKYFILDEAQNIKNFKSQRWQSLLNFQSQRRLLLTGTPLQNNLMELWSLMHFLMPHVFASHREFQQWFSNPLKFMIEGNQEYNEQLVKRLHKVLRPFLLRRLKVDVEKQMPKKYEHIIRCKLSKRQRLLYDEFMSNTKTKQTLNEGNYMSVINVLMQLRKVCNHPDLFDPRPIVSPFVCESIAYRSPSIVYNLSESLLNVNQYFSNISDLELNYSAFTCHRTRKLQISKKQIEDTILSAAVATDDQLEEAEEGDESSMFYFDKKLIISSNELNISKRKRSMGGLSERRAARVKHNIQFISRINRQRCVLKPIYGQDLQDYVGRLVEPVKLKSFVDDYNWSSGYANCREISGGFSYYWKHTEALREIIHATANDYFQELKDLILRFVIYIPPVKCFNTIRLHCSHPDVSLKRREQILVEEINEEIHQHLRMDDTCDYLFKIGTLLNTQFPEKRLIQYDCGKLQSLDVLLHRLYVGTHRVLLFTQMTRMLDVLENFLNYHGYKYLRLDGSTTIENRQVLMERFNNDKRIFCFILSTRSGGVGVNLTGADTVIFYDSDWNPTMDAQAQDRCHRIGQTRDVNIYRLICEKTIEENILKKANQKRLLSEVTIEGGCFTTAVLKKHNIKELFDQPTGLLNESEFVDLGGLIRRGGKGVGHQQDDQDQDQDEANNPIMDKVNEVVMFSHNIVQDLHQHSTASVPLLAPTNTISQIQFEDALAMVEDETDVLAARELKAEVVADNAEFDEDNIVIWDEETSKKKQFDCQYKFENELKSIENELKPIERYAFKFLEEFGNIAQSFKDESNVIEIEKAKRDWEMQRLIALKEEEEREAELEDEEMMYTYPKTEVNNNSYLKSNKKKGSSKLFVNSNSSSTTTTKPTPVMKVTRSSRTSAGSTPTTSNSNSKTTTVTPVAVVKKSLIENELLKYNKLLNEKKGGGGKRDEKTSIVNKKGKESKVLEKEEKTKKGTKKKKFNNNNDDDVNKAADAAVADVVASISSTKSNKIQNNEIIMKQQQQPPISTIAAAVAASTTQNDIKRGGGGGVKNKSLENTENIYKKPFISYRNSNQQQQQSSRIKPITIVNNTSNTNNYIINNTTNNYTFITTIASSNQQQQKKTTAKNNDDNDNDLLLTAETTPTSIDIRNLFNFKQFNTNSSILKPPPQQTQQQSYKIQTTPIAAAALATTINSTINSITSKPIVINKSVFTATTKSSSTTQDNNPRQQTQQPMKPITTLIKRNNNNNN